MVMGWSWTTYRSYGSEMRKIKRIVIHHSDSDWGTANIIRHWHIQRGWSDCGYHFVISNGVPAHEDFKEMRRFESMVGQIEYGRPLDADPWMEDSEKGAHAYGFNSDSIGICLIHRSKKYPNKMIWSLLELVTELCMKFDIDPENIVGHYELDPKKPMCPGINMIAFRTKIKNNISRAKNKISISNIWARIKNER